MFAGCVVFGVLILFLVMASRQESFAFATAEQIKSASGCAQGRLSGEYLRRQQQAGMMLAMPAPLTAQDVQIAETVCTDHATAELIQQQGAALGFTPPPGEGPAAAAPKAK